MESKSTMSESSIEKKFKKLCERHGMRVIKMSAQFEWGIPDRLVLFEGFAGFCELKAPGKKPQRHQDIYLKKLQMEGNFVGVVSDPNDIVSWIGEFKKHINEKNHVCPPCRGLLK